MAMSQKIKQAANSLFKGKTLTYTKKPSPRKVQIRTTSKPKKQGVRSYKDKGYEPSNGIGVGF